jgi:hypothetical protein
MAAIAMRFAAPLPMSFPIAQPRVQRSNLELLATSIRVRANRTSKDGIAQRNTRGASANE